MAHEITGTREWLVTLNEKFPDKEFLSKRDACKAAGKYPGGKWRISKWIISHFPKHKVYVEPYFGSGAVFFNKEPSYIETINDVDGNIVNLFKVCRESPDKLAQLIELTPFSREEFEECYEIAVDDPVERARRTLVRFHQSFGTTNSTKLSSIQFLIPQ